MNQQDRKEFEIIHLKIDDLRNDIDQMRSEMKAAHDKTEDSFEWFRKDIFNPKQGLWHETNMNSQFRRITTWIGSVVFIAVVGLVMEKLI